MESKPLPVNPPEINLTQVEVEFRTNRFKDLADELNSLIAGKTGDRRIRSTAKTLRHYVEQRLQMLEWAENRLNIVGRVKRISDPPIEHPFLRWLKEMISRGLYPIAKDGRDNVVPYWERRIVKLVEKVAGDAAFYDALLIEILPNIEDELRPYSCLPHEEEGQGTPITPVAEVHHGDNDSPIASAQQNEPPIGSSAINAAHCTDDAVCIDDSATDTSPVMGEELEHASAPPNATDGNDIEAKTVDPKLDDHSKKPWLPPTRQKQIKVLGALRSRNKTADAITEIKDKVTPNQCDAAILRYGYNMSDTEIAHLMGGVRKTAYDHCLAFNKAVSHPPLREVFKKILRARGLDDCVPMD